MPFQPQHLWLFHRQFQSWDLTLSWPCVWFVEKGFKLEFILTTVHLWKLGLLGHFYAFLGKFSNYHPGVKKVIYGRSFILVVGVCHAFRAVWCEIEIYPICVRTAIDFLALTKLDEKTYPKMSGRYIKELSSQQIEIIYGKSFFGIQCGNLKGLKSPRKLFPLKY